MKTFTTVSVDQLLQSPMVMNTKKDTCKPSSFWIYLSKHRKDPLSAQPRYTHARTSQTILVQLSKASTLGASSCINVITRRSISRAIVADSLPMKCEAAYRKLNMGMALRLTMWQFPCCWVAPDGTHSKGDPGDQRNPEKPQTCCTWSPSSPPGSFDCGSHPGQVPISERNEKPPYDNCITMYMHSLLACAGLEAATRSR